MSSERLLLLALRFLHGFFVLLSIFFFFLFKILYWNCPTAFNAEGRCFDAVNSVVYEQDAFWNLPLALGFAAVALLAWWLARKWQSRMKSRS